MDAFTVPNYGHLPLQQSNHPAFALIYTNATFHFWHPLYYFCDSVIVFIIRAFVYMSSTI